MKKLLRLLICMVLILALSVSISWLLEYKKTNDIGQKIFSIKCPDNTQVIDRTLTKSSNDKIGWGNGDYQVVVATMKFSTKLSKKEVLKYYSQLNVSKNQSLEGNEFDVYFEGEFLRKFDEGLVFYEKISKRKSGDLAQNADTQLIFVIQLKSGY